MSANQPLNERAASPFWRVQDWRIAPKLVAAFLLVALVPIAITASITTQSARDALLSQGALQLTAKCNSTGTAIDQYLVAHREDIVAASTLSSFTVFAANPNDASIKATALRELKALANKKYYESIALVNAKGTVILSSSDADLGTDLQFRPYFTEALKGTSGYVSDPSISVVTNQPAIFFSSPIVDSGGNILGVVRSQLGLAGIVDLIDTDTDAAGPGTFGMLLDENGIRIAYGSGLQNRLGAGNTVLYTAIAPLPAEVENQMVSEKRWGNAATTNVTVLPLREVTAAIANPATVTFESSADGSSVRHYAAISSLKIKPWHYVLMTPLPTFTSSADTLRLVWVLIAIIVAVITIVGALLLARGFTQPIVQLTQVADRISLGELDTPIEINRHDEIGELAEAVSRMQASLQAAIERLRARRTGS